METTPSQPRRAPWDFLFLMGLWLVIGVVYAPALNGAIIFDDAQIIRDGTLRSDLLSSAPRFVTNLSYVLVDQTFDKSVVAQKVCNLVLHGLAVSLLYGLTLALLALAPRNSLAAGSDKNAARVGTAVFALNPCAVYATAYLVQRSILLATVFTILMMLLFLTGLRTRNKLYFAGAAVSYALAVLSKELAVMVICIPPLIYILVRSPPPRQVAAATVGTLAVVACVATAYLRQYNLSLLSPYEPAAAQYLTQAGLLGAENGPLYLVLHLLNQLNLFFAYGFIWMLPHPLWMSIDLQPLFPTLHSMWYYVPLGLLFLLLLAFATKCLFQKSPRTKLVGLLILVPMLLFQTELWMVRVQEPFSIYRSYLWAISIPGLVALAISCRFRKQLLVAGLALCIWQTGVAMNRVSTFTSNLEMWSDAIEKSTTTPYFRGFGVWRHYINRGAAHLNHNDVRRALEDFRRADSLGALHGVGQYNIGVVFQTLGLHQDALEALKKAESKNQQDPVLQYRLGEAYYALHKPHEALQSYRNAAALGARHENSFSASLRMAEVLILLGQFQEASLVLADLTRLEPENQRVAVGLGMANFGLGNIEKATMAFQRSLATSPNANAYYGLALVRESQAQFSEAQKLVGQALSMEPDNPAFAEFQSHLNSRPHGGVRPTATPTPAPQPTAAATPPAARPRR